MKKKLTAYNPLDIQVDPIRLIPNLVAAVKAELQKLAENKPRKKIKNGFKYFAKDKKGWYKM